MLLGFLTACYSPIKMVLGIIFLLFMVLQTFYLLLFLLMRESALVVGAPATTSSE